MAPLSSLAVAALVLAAANAHFTLDYPATIGFDDDNEGTGPCGSFTPDFSKDNVTDFHVGGDNVAMNLLHPQGTWLFRATLDQTAASGWRQLFPETQQSGLGKFCEPMITVPSNWTGQKGVLGVVVDGPDGILFQCAAVNFVSGTASTTQSTCTNGSSITASFVSDANLAPYASGNGSTSSTSSTPTTSTTGGSSSPSTTKNAAPRVAGEPLSFGSLLAGTGMFLLGAAFLL